MEVTAGKCLADRLGRSLTHANHMTEQQYRINDIIVTIHEPEDRKETYKKVLYFYDK